ncbi:MAG: hypothetical protein V7638_2226 [Acidobacteriota bacterium]|jgi:WD40 repeat protein
MTFLRSLCSGVLIVLVFSVIAFGQRRIERVAPQVKTAVSPSGQTVAIARSNVGIKNRSGRVELWDATSGELQRTITGFDGPIWSMSFSKDGKLLVTISTESTRPKTQPSDKAEPDPQTAEIKWWDVNSGEFLRRKLLGSEGIWSVEASWSPAGDVVALIERYSRGLWVPSTRPQSIASDWVNNVELKLGLFDAQSLETRRKIEGGEQRGTGQFAFFVRMAHPVFSSDGEMLAAVSGTDVKLWNVDSGKKFRTIREFNGAPSAIAFSPDGDRIAVAAVDGSMPGGKSEIRVLEVSTGRLLNKLNGLNDSVACLQFAAEGRTLMIGTLQYEPERAVGTVKIWSLVDNRLFRFDVNEGKTVSSMTVIPNHRAIVLQSDTDVELRDLQTWKVIHSFVPSPDDESESLRRSPFLLSANRAVAVGFGSDGITVSSMLPSEIRIWDSRTGGVKDRHPRAPVDVIATSSNGELIAEATSGQVRLIEVRTGASKILNVETNGRISAIALSADGRTLVTGDELGSIQLSEVSTGHLIKSFETGKVITALAVDTSRQIVAAATADRLLGLWSVRTGTEEVELKKQRDVVRALAFSPDGRTLASGGDDRNLILWEIGSGKATLTFEKGDTAITSIAFSPDGQLLASGAGNESVFLWNVKTGKLERILR